MDIKKKFGENLKNIRLKKGISQEELAYMSGLHRTYISSIELGKRNVSLVNIHKLSMALNCQITELFKDLEN